MNGDLISRYALKEHKFLTSQVKVIGDRYCGKTREQIIEAYQKGWNDAIDAIIENAPAVEPTKGEWLHPYITNIACECSICHMQMPITDYFNFCPNCGAIMKGGAE